MTAASSARSAERAARRIAAAIAAVTDDEAGTFELDVTAPGDSLHYERDGDGGTSVNGTFDGKRVSLEGGRLTSAPGPGRPAGASMDDDLVASGRYLRIRARGGRTGEPRTVTVGFIDDEASPGALLVASRAGSAWARNLLTNPACQVESADRTFAAVAEPLEAADHARAIRELILRYGTPAEGLGHGPSFRLRPVATPREPAA